MKQLQRRGSGLGLKSRLVFALGALLALPLLCFDAWQLYDWHTARLHSLDARAQQLASALAAAQSNPIWEYDKEAGKAALEGLLEDPEFFAVRVTDDAGEPFAILGPVGPFESNLLDDSLLRVHRRVHLKSRDGSVDRDIGSVDLILTTELVHRSTRQALLTSVARLVLLLIFLILGMLFAIGLFTRPIENMTAIMRRRETGDFDAEVEPRYLKRQDEIGAIARSLEYDQQQRRDEIALLNVSTKLSSNLNFEQMLKDIMSIVTELLDAERSSLFVHDTKTGELVARVVEGLDGPLRIPDDSGYAGHAFSNNKVINVKKAYGDVRFNSAVDQKTDFTTHNLLTIPIVGKNDQPVGAMQVINARAGAFSTRDERRGMALAAQIGIALENVALFDEVMNLQAYQEAIYESLSNGVLTFDENETVVSLNHTAESLVRWPHAELIGQKAESLLSGKNSYLLHSLRKVALTQQPDELLDCELLSRRGEVANVNVTTTPLRDLRGGPIGTMLVFDDITAQRRMRTTMSRYLSKQVVDQLLEGDPDVLAGVTRNASVLFSDIRGFTTLSERIGARETVRFLNDYFEVMVDCISERDGVLDKYIGDAIMALFGVPFENDGDADNAVWAAVDMLSALQPFNRRQHELNKPQIQVGVGINTGELAAGNIGSTKRVEYTVIGDTVNLAARLEGVTKFYGAPIVISEHTLGVLNKRPTVRSLDLLQVKGKTQPVEIFEVLEPRAKDGVDIITFGEQFDEALRLFRMRAFEQALEAFETFRDAYPEELTTLHYIERCRHLRATPPSDDWDGVWVMRTK
tara:strand:+ start:1989 stop:4403 length:2415 start_codon:yes stop_codon:yes gene_type:complete